jgi:exodeoxyribonuclease VII large subunit
VSLGLAPHSSSAAEPGSSADTAVAVSTLNQVLKDVVEGAFMPLWIRGEVSDFKHHRNGHWYFTLRDGSSQMRCVTWSRDQKRIPAAPDDGMQVALYGQLTVYAARGDVQFTAKQVEAEGDGLWRKAFEQAKLRLEADGLLGLERKRALPEKPRRIAVITSPDGAALHDIIHVVRKRCPSVEIVVVPAKVQGEGAAAELCRAVDMVTRWCDADLLIIGRGGGAREDLWCFNDETLARRLSACPMPTISAVGHEVDNTICDLVADYRAATPSAAAEAAVPAVPDLSSRLRSRASYIRRGFLQLVRARRDTVRERRRQFPAQAARLLRGGEVRLGTLASRIHDLSPLSAMARGYSVATGDDGQTLTRTSSFNAGQRFTLHVADGSVDAIVENVNLNEKEETNVI